MKPEQVIGSDLTSTTFDKLNTDYTVETQMLCSGGEDDIVSSSSSPAQSEMSLTEFKCDSRVVPKDKLTLLYNINNRSPSALSNSNQDDSDFNWDDSSSWQFIFRFNSQQTEIHNHSNLLESFPIPPSNQSSYDEAPLSPQKISQQIHNQDSEEGLTTNTEQTQYIFPQRTLLVIHPFLTLQSGDIAVNCYLPKKSRKLSCVTVKRDPKEPVSVSVNLNADISIADLLEELSTEQGMSSGSSNLHTLKSSDVANGHIFQSYQSSSTSSLSFQNTFNQSHYSNTTRTTTNHNSNQHSLTTNFSPVSHFRSPSSTATIIKQQEFKVVKADSIQPTIFASNSSFILQTGSQSQLITPGILTNKTTSAILKSNSIPLQLQLPSPRVIMGTTNSKKSSVIHKSESSTETKLKARQSVVPIQGKTTNFNKESGQQKQHQAFGITIQPQRIHDFTVLSTTKTPSGSDGEIISRIVICPDCSQQSRTFQTCEHCKRVIPKDAKVLSIPPMANLQNYKIPKKNSGKRPTIKSKIVEISLSSDEEDSSPGKKQKIEENDNNNGADINSQTSFTPTSPTEVITTTITTAVTPTQGKIISQVKTGSRNNATATNTFSVKKMQDLPICSLQNENNSNQTTDLKAIKEEIQILLSTENSITATLDCTIIQVGSYKLTTEDNEAREEDFKVNFSEKGIIFRMKHCTSPGMLLTLVIPHSSILGTTVHFTVRQPSFVVVKIGNKLAKYWRTKLGMIVGGAYWFDVSSPDASARNIVFVTEKLTEIQLKNIKQIYGATFTDLDYAHALKFRQDMKLKFEGDESDLEFRKSSSSTPIPKSTTKTTIVQASGKSNNSRLQSAVIKTPVNNGQNPTGIIKAGTPVPVLGSGYVGENKKIFTWPKGQGIALSQADIFTLKGEQFLNDQIIDFWLTYVLHNLSKDDRERTHVFSTFFYTRLTQKPTRKHCPSFETDKKLTAAEKRHLRVKKWTKKVDIFSKDFIIIPIVDSCHWYLAVICYPGLSGPHWANDNTPIENWKNVGLQNKHPIYQPPPGMPHSGRFKSRKSKPCSADEHSTTTTNSLATSTLSTPITPSSQELSGNPTKINPQTQSSDLDSKKQPIIPLTCSPSEDRDEEEDDPDENLLFDEFYSTDSDDSSTTGEKKKANGDTSSVQSTVNPTSSLPKENEDAQLASNNQDVEMKPDVASCDIKPEPMDIDDPQDIKQENPEGVRTDFRIKQPCIILFDSLSGTSRSRVFNTLREYLRLEYKERKGGEEERSFTKFEMPGFMPNVPQQKNLYDCGLYLLEYAEHFFSKPFPSFCLPITDLKKWFPLLKLKRKEIYDTIYKLVETESKDSLPLMPKFDAAALTSVTTSIQDSIMAALSAQSSASKASSSLSATPKIEKISAVQVESAPRQLLTPVKPSEEPMDVDVESTAK